MREILFRGKTEQGKWVYGYYWQTINNIHSQPRFYIREKSYSWDIKEYEVDYKTVGQFTGLTDKNGKRIFEGDIIKSITVDTNTEQFAVIGFDKFIDENNDDEYLGFYIEFDGFKTTITQLEMEEVKNRFEVIGNIHDNKELLGE